LAVRTNRRDAQVGAAEIDSDRKIRHGQKGNRTCGSFSRGLARGEENLNHEGH
jgi:hypothetical protein